MRSIELSPTTSIPFKFANRHGLIAGATGSGKTRTVQTIVEQCSAAGVPVLLTDIKGDLTGLSKGFPVRFWDLFGEEGMPMKTSVHEMGAAVLSRLLGLNAVQEGVLNIAYKWCTDKTSPHYGTRIFQLDDLRAVLTHMLDYAEDLRETHGNVTNASVGAIQRAILNIEGQGADALFGEPALRLDDILCVESSGKGMVNVIAADRLMESRSLYSGFMIHLLMTLFNHLPEVGDAEKPKLVIIMDEAHLIFADAPKLLVETVERIVRLIRSRGVGVYFASQNALDIPEKIAAQLGNRVQHAMRAFTPKEHSAVKAVAKTFRQSKGVDTVKAMTEMGIGEALVSVIGAGGVPTEVVLTKISLPTSQLEPIEDMERIALIRKDAARHYYAKRFADESVEYTAFMERLDGEAMEQINNRRDKPSWRDEAEGAAA